MRYKSGKLRYLHIRSSYSDILRLSMLLIQVLHPIKLNLSYFHLNSVASCAAFVSGQAAPNILLGFSTLLSSSACSSSEIKAITFPILNFLSARYTRECCHIAIINKALSASINDRLNRQPPSSKDLSPFARD